MKNIALASIALASVLFVSGCQQATVEGVWKGVALLLDDGSSDTIEAKLTKIGDSFSGTVLASDKQGQKTDVPMKELKISGQEITFKLGDKTCKGIFSSDNSKLTGKCMADSGSPAGGMSFELTKN